jgi:hypothetical protein
MSTIVISKVQGDKATLDWAAVESFKSSLRGQLLRPGDPGYDQARTVWNAMIDRKPALIVRCMGVSDIRQAVSFAREHSLLTSIKGGGHNIAGNAVCDGGLMIDLSGMRAVSIDPWNRIANVEPGATLGDFDHEAQTFNLVTPLGINSTTGVAGLTLGGGFGWLSRKHGMTIDNLISVDVVTADSQLLRASASENSDLFWAIRGGGGNFGIVTKFVFKLHFQKPEILSGLVAYKLQDGIEILKKYRDFVKVMHPESSVWAVLRKAPPLPFIPPEMHGKEIVVLAMIHFGDPDEGQKALEPVRNFGEKVGEFMGVQPYCSWQTLLDPMLTPGARNYWKSNNFSDLSDRAIDVLVKQAWRLPSSQCEIALGLIGGATARLSKDYTAYSHRDATYVMNVHGRWDNASDDDKCMDWARTLYRETAPYATGGVYVNFLTDDESERIKAAYGTNFEKLVAIKKKYDPNNLFRMNQNINPGA